MTPMTTVTPFYYISLQTPTNSDDSPEAQVHQAIVRMGQLLEGTVVKLEVCDIGAEQRSDASLVSCRWVISDALDVISDLDDD